MRKEENSWVLNDWTVYPDLNLIQNHTSEFSVKPRLMKLLEFFLINQEKVVTKEAILDFVWEDRIVTENLLTKSISELRKLLEERFPGELEIETIRNVGYRFNLKFEISQSIDNEPTVLDATQIPKSKSLQWGLLTIGLLLTIIAFSFYTKKKKTELQVTVERITSLEGQELSPIISPNGKKMAYIWREQVADPFHVYVRSLDENNARKLGHNKSTEYNPIWSPDGNHIIFMRQESSEQLKLIKHSVIGDDETVLIDLSGFFPLRGIIWTIDKKRLIFSARKKLDEPYALYAFDLINQSLKQLTNPPKESFGDLHPSVSGTEHIIAFIRVDESKAKTTKALNAKSTLHLLNLQNSKVESIASLPNDVKTLVYHSKLKKYFCWLSAEIVDNQLWAIDRDGGTQILLQNENGMPGKGMMAVDGIFYYEYWQSDLNVDKYFLNTPLEISDTSSKYLNATVWDWGLRMASASDEMAFISFRSGHKEIWSGPATDPEQARQITDFKGLEIKSLSISPDGKNILFLSTSKGFSTIHVIQNNGQHLQKIEESEADFSNPEWSVDGKSFYFGSNQSGLWTILEKELSDKNTNSLIERSRTILADPFDTSQVFYSSVKLDSIFSLDKNTGASELLFTPVGLVAGNWVIAEKGIYYLSTGEGFRLLKFFDFLTKKTKKLKDLNHVLPGIPSLTISNDGQMIFVAEAGGINADLMSLKIE